MTMVYVQNKDGKPLMPTTRYCYVRLLLKEKKARVVSRTPFTIQLNYDTPDITQDLILGIDPRQDEYRRCCRQGGRPVRVLRTSGDSQQGSTSLDEEACRIS